MASETRLQARFLADRRGAIGVWIGLAVPTLLMAVGVSLNVAEGMVARQEMQRAADLAAQAGAIAYSVDSNASAAATAAANVAELNGVAGAGERSWNAGTKTMVSNQVTVLVATGAVNPSSTAIQVTAQRTVPVVFADLLGTTATRNISANSVAEVWGGGAGGPGGAGGGGCVLAMHPTAASAIKVDNMGRILTPGCGIFANSSASGTGVNAAIYLNSGTLSGQSVSTVGKLCLSNSGSNTISPSVPNNSCISPGGTAQADPFAALAVPSPSQPADCPINATYGVCCRPPIVGTVGSYSASNNNVVNASYTAWQAAPRQFSPANGGAFCGNTTIGGNGAQDQFAPGVYYVVNGDLTFNNSAVSSAAGVSFVLIKRGSGNPGRISWTNYSNTYVMSAPASGPTAGILFWQDCKADGTAPENTMAGGSTLTITGAFYAKCGKLTLTNNIQMNAAVGQSMKVVANTIYVAGSAAISASAGVAPPATANVALVQ